KNNGNDGNFALGGCFAGCLGQPPPPRRRRRGSGLRRILSGKTVLVTGASSGLGEALAAAFARQGARLLLAGRDVDKLKATQQRLSEPARHAVVQLDLAASDGELSGDAASRVWAAAGGRLDLLINNAGQSYRGEIVETEMGVHRRLMQAGCDLTVVGISSLQGLVSQPYRSAYAASKHAFSGAFHDGLRAELSRHEKSGKVYRVLTVSPAYIRTGLSANALTASGAAYAKTDYATASGMTPEAAAEAVLDALESDSSELLLGPWHLRAAPLLRRLAPWLMFKIMAKRASSGGVTK
uniref:SDR family NAD(P)-dependent oxidoreductase n=1 Tax=Macrostomum lignano TaxID=282301 RepID=A0A1I8FB18_9PLAT